MVDATAADEEPDAHEILLHAENDSAALRHFFQFNDDGTLEVVAAMVALLGSDQAAPVVAASSQHRPNVERGALKAGARLARDDDVGDVPFNRAESFRRYLCMRRHFFLRDVRAVDDPDDYFQQRHDATEKLGLIAPQKCTAAIRQLAYGTSADAVDEYVRSG
ncbi:hypothetical protein PF008_g2866 [Phytophthora fragariae]|uniref:Uncharacterized protein n=1 Tax=Phytophthora fragariae TaxID=53985 RepID=A0A6G0SGD8_9STRA|nr:hypothetical protein PF008_g2866 [Phytophthora fragariae]